MVKKNGRALALLSVLFATGTLHAQAARETSAPPPGEAVKPTSSYVIHAGRLLAQPGEAVQSNKSILVEDGRIVAIKDGFVHGPEIIDLSRAFVLPGMINLHTHMALPSAAGNATWRLQRPDALLLETIPRLKNMVEAGFTTVRDVGDESSIMYELADASRRGIVVGPRILASEPFFGIGNGYFSAYTVGLKAELEPFYLNRGQCVGRDQCRNAVREEVKRGAKVIKIRLSFLPIQDPQIESVETVEEIKWIIDMAHQLNRTVAVHTVVGTSLAPVTNAILAGADTIEHGPLGPDQVSLMKRMGTVYVPTLSVAKTSAGYPGLYARIRAGSILAAKSGVKFGFGTDFPLIPVASGYEEFLELQDIGLTPAEAIKAATVNAADSLNMSDRIGSIAPGKFADVIAVKGDPLVDLRALGDVIFVMKEGTIIKAAR